MYKLFILLLILLLSPLSYSAVQPISAEKAFALTVDLQDPNTVRLHWQIEEGYYLYQERFFIQPLTPDWVRLGNFRWPEATSKSESMGRNYPIYRNSLLIDLPVLGLNHGPSALLINYQGCSDSGFCYPPQSKQLNITFDDNLAAREVLLEDYAPPPSNTQSALETVLGQHFWLAILTFWGFGLLLAFTPCVLPMIPVLSGIILGHHKDLTSKHALSLSATYVLGMSISYAGLGVVIALLGANLQALMQNEISITLFALLFVALSLSMFGLYDLQLPRSLQLRFANLSRTKEGGNLLGVFTMGVLSTLILSPCVTPPLVGALSYIAHTGNVFMGGLALFFLGLGMGTPLLLVGTSLATLLPKAGYWMNSIKHVIGVSLLAMAVLLLERILPNSATLLLWAGLLMTTGLFMGALQRNAESVFDKLWQGAGLLFLVYGAICIVGVGLGNGSVLHPLKGLTSAKSEHVTSEKKTSRKTIFSLDQLNEEIALSQGKPLLVDFYADWCLSCKVLESTVFQDPTVQQTLANFTVIKADITRNDVVAQTLMKQFGIIAPPTVLVFDKNGELQKESTLVGEFSQSALLKNLRSVP